MFQKYQSMPKQVEAIQFTEENKDSIFNSLTGRYAADFEDGKPLLKVETVHGEISIARRRSAKVVLDKIKVEANR